MKHERLVLDAASYTLAGYLVQPLSLVSALFIRGHIGPYATGVIATLNLILFYLSFAHLGVLNAAERDLPYSIGSANRDKFEHIRDTTFSVTMGAGLMCAIGLAATAVLIRRGIEHDLFVGMMIYAPYVVLWYWCAYHITLLRTNQEFVFLSKVQVAVNTLSSLGGMVGAVLFGFTGVVTSLLVVTSVQAILVTRQVGHGPRLRIDNTELRRLLLVGVPLLLFGLAMTVIKTLDNVLVLRFMGTEALGIYSVALLANSAIFQATSSLSGVLYPRMQKAFGETQSISGIVKYVVRPSLITALVIPLLIACLEFVVPPVVTWLLPDFAPGLMAFRIVAVGSYWLAMTPMAANFLITVNKQLTLTWLLVLSIAVWVPLTVLFLAFGWGLAGIALATCGGYAVCFVGINTAALRHWASWAETARFLWNMTLPGCYGATLIVLISSAWSLSGYHVATQLAISVVQCVMFVAAYLPLVYWMEPHTHLWAEILRPGTRRLAPYGWVRRILPEKL